MELLDTYPVNIEQWTHKENMEFLGSNDMHMNYGFALSRPELFDSAIYFIAKVKRVYTNQLNGVVFHGETSTTFKIRYREAPTVNFLFGLVERACNDFALVFEQRKKRTTLMYHQIEKPIFSELQGFIQRAIDDWDHDAVEFKKLYGDRLTKFKDLPEIPIHKQYDEQNVSTVEQRISHKLHMGQQIDEDERAIFNELGSFYDVLFARLVDLNYASFDGQDIRDFKNYMLYAFNFSILLTNELTIYKLYRLVVNETFTKKNDSITDATYLMCPSIDIVTKYGKFNRANTCDSTVFYLAESIDTALQEIRPVPGQRVTVGVWKPKRDRTFTTFPIVHYNSAVEANPEISLANKKINDLVKHHDPLHMDYMNYYLYLLSMEFSKPIKHHLEYLISAFFSEHIFNIKDPNPDYDFDCIIYPSVGNSFRTRNVAMRSDVAKDMMLEEVIEFEITASYYNDRPLPNANPRKITVADIDNYRETKIISEDGKIYWSNYIKMAKLERG